MLTVRTSTRGGPWLDVLGGGIAEALREHPLAPSLSALVLIGAGDPLLIRDGDPSLRVMVPLLGTEPAGAMARRQMQAMDGLVLLDPAEASAAEGGTVTLLVGQVGTTGLLRSSPPFQELEAAVAMDALPAVRDAVQRARPGSCTPSLSADAIAGAVVEAIVAAGAPDARS